MYIYDTDFDVQPELRSQNVPGADRALLTHLARMRNQHNTFTQSFMSLPGLSQNIAPTDWLKIVIHAENRPANEHVSRYNGLCCYNIAALIAGNENGMIGKRDILVRKRGQDKTSGNEVLVKVSITHRSYDPLIYVVLFHDGTDEWHPELLFVEGEHKGSSDR